MIITNVYVERIEGDKKEIKKVHIETNDPNGVHETYKLQLANSGLANFKLVEKSYSYEIINREWWEKYIGELKKFE